jgi:hypothetical protein
MKKHRIDKIREISGASEPEITPEHHKKNVERVVDMIMDVVDRLPENPAPVSESYEELLDQMRHGVKRQPTVIQNDFSKITHAEATKMNEKVDTGINAKVDTFTETEMEILRKIQNGE